MIKYRVWDNTEQKYDYDGYSIGCDGKLYKSGGVVELAKDYIIEQYTGLKDKNGVEIAVGDVVRARGYSGYDNYSIVYSEHHASFNMRRTDTPKWMRISEAIGRPHTGDMEVIGNIHENAELLEEYKSGE